MLEIAPARGGVRLDHVEHAVPLAGAQIVRDTAGLGLEPAQGGEVLGVG